MSMPSDVVSARAGARRAGPVLDPCTLGRPVHLLDAFTLPFKADLAGFLMAELNRRYRAAFEVGAVTIARARPADSGAGRWLNHADTVGGIGVAIERCLLLSVLGHRYGDPTLKAPVDGGDAVPETATEERLAASLGLRLVQLLAARIDACGPAGAAPVVRSFVPVPPSGAGRWLVRAEVSEAAQGVHGLLWFTLDEAWMGRLLRHLAPARDKPAPPAGDTPFPARLQLTLTGRLLEKDVALGELLDLRVGDVLPISLGPTDVLVDDARLFTAAVAERQGKLCLTSFEFVE